MQLSSKRARSLIYFSILPLLLLGFAVHGSSRHAKHFHARISHRVIRTGSRTGEASIIDNACGDTQTSGVISLHSHGDHPPQRSVSLAALPAVAVPTFAAGYFVLLPRGNIAPDVRSPAFDSTSLRGPPAVSSL
jgi:hypothetical protein